MSHTHSLGVDSLQSTEVKRRKREGDEGKPSQREVQKEKGNVVRQSKFTKTVPLVSNEDAQDVKHA